MTASFWESVKENTVPKNWMEMVTSAILREAVYQFPSCLWSTEETAALEACANLEIKEVPENEWPSIVRQIVPFMREMCGVPHVQGIGFDCAQMRVDLLVDPIDTEILYAVVGKYCAWQEANLDIPYFDIQTVSEQTFGLNREAYSIIAIPKE